MSLFAADLRALANLPTTAVGRRISLGMVIGLVLLSLMAWWAARWLLDRDEFVLALLSRSEEPPLLGLLGYALLTCPIVSTWLGLAIGQRQLFETPELMLWRQAPLPGWRGPVQIFARAVFLSTLWASALAAPLLVALLQKTSAPPAAYWLIPLAVMACTAPLLATLLSVQIVMVRFLAGRWLRLVLSAIAALASVGFTIWLLLNLFSSGEARLAEVQAAATSGHRLPATVRAAAVMLHRAAEGRLLAADVAATMLSLLVAGAVFGLASLLHPRAHERYLESDRPIWRRSNRRWPTTLASNVRRKEFAQVLQQPGALIGFLVFSLVVFALAREHVLVGGILSQTRLPREIRELAALLSWWFLAVLLVLYTHMGRLALWDGAQWPLYMASPARPGAILRGKLQAIAAFLLWPLLLVAVVGVQMLAVDARTIGWFVGFALAGTLAALGVVAVIGTWPRLMRPDAEGQILQGGKSFLAAMVMVTTFQIAMAPAMASWTWLVRDTYRNPLRSDVVADQLPLALAAALAYGAVLALLGTWLGSRNYRALLAPR
ncbi:MAG: hypothetical protein KAI24_17465 [Planctomycetes bacterium]|nr:hypothetical protein [Planctomycetota bacterium]